MLSRRLLVPFCSLLNARRCLFLAFSFIVPCRGATRCCCCFSYSSNVSLLVPFPCLWCSASADLHRDGCMHGNSALPIFFVVKSSLSAVVSRPRASLSLLDVRIHPNHAGPLRFCSTKDNRHRYYAPPHAIEKYHGALDPTTLNPKSEGAVRLSICTPCLDELQPEPLTVQLQVHTTSRMHPLSHPHAIACQCINAHA